MGKVIMSCGHKAKGDEWKVGYWWKEWNSTLSYGTLCDKCVPMYRAVRADSVEEAVKLLKREEVERILNELRERYDDAVELKDDTTELRAKAAAIYLALVDLLELILDE